MFGTGGPSSASDSFSDRFCLEPPLRKRMFYVPDDGRPARPRSSRRPQTRKRRKAAGESGVGDAFVIFAYNKPMVWRKTEIDQCYFERRTLGRRGLGSTFCSRRRVAWLPSCGADGANVRPSSRSAGNDPVVGATASIGETSRVHRLCGHRTK